MSKPEPTWTEAVHTVTTWIFKICVAIGIGVMLFWVTRFAIVTCEPFMTNLTDHGMWILLIMFISGSFSFASRKR